MSIHITAKMALGDFATSLSPDRINKDMISAINHAASMGRTFASKDIRGQINFKPSYLTRNLTVRQASQGNAVASITGRGRPTALSRFLTVAPRKGRRDPRVRVSPGRTLTMSGAWIMALKSGNFGIAVRAGPEGIRNKRFAAKPLYAGKNTNVYLLYGPSVNQVFRMGTIDRTRDYAATIARREFIRLQSLKRRR